MKPAAEKRFSALLAVMLILTLGFIWGNSLLSRDASREVSQGLLAGIADFLAGLNIIIDTENDHWLRKLAHFSEFGLLAAELCLLMFVNGRAGIQGFFNCASLGLAAAVIDEALQLISKRGSQVQDVLLDFAGFAAGLILCGGLCLLHGKRKK